MARNRRETPDREEEQRPELLADVTALQNARWRTTGDAFTRLTLQSGERDATIYADAATATRLLRLLSELPAYVADLRAENARLTAALEEAKARPAAAPAARGEPMGLEDVPLAMIAPFAVTPDLQKTARRDPLVALAVQVSKAAQEDASALERARLLAMAAAASRGDLDAFWTASQNRSPKALAAMTTGRGGRAK